MKRLTWLVLIIALLALSRPIQQRPRECAIVPCGPDHPIAETGADGGSG